MREQDNTQEDGHPDLSEIEDGTKVRYKYTRGKYAGEVAEGEIRSGHIIYKGNRYSPTGAARKALYDIRGSEYEVNGWEWWKYYDSEENEWVPLSELK